MCNKPLFAVPVGSAVACPALPGKRPKAFLSFPFSQIFQMVLRQGLLVSGSLLLQDGLRGGALRRITPSAYPARHFLRSWASCRRQAGVLAKYSRKDGSFMIPPRFRTWPSQWYRSTATIWAFWGRHSSAMSSEDIQAPCPGSSAESVRDLPS